MNIRFGEAELWHTTKAGWKKRADLVFAISPDAKGGNVPFAAIFSSGSKADVLVFCMPSLGNQFSLHREGA